MMFIAFIFGLCWGSFLHAMAVRMVRGTPLMQKRSRCPHCSALIVWYDNIPLLSWLALRGRCRSCKQPISPLYPLLELITGLTIALWWMARGQALWHGSGYSILGADALFLSALMVATATDLHALVIPQCASLWLVPLGLLAAGLHITPLTLPHAVLAAAIGYGSLWLVNWLFKRARGRDGMGVGDMELLAMIGAFLGLPGLWTTLLVGSWIGLAAGLVLKLRRGAHEATLLPFGPALATGAVVHLLWGQKILSWWLGS